MTPNLLIRADASASLGTGHVMRMIALAQAWKQRGGKTTVAAIELPPPLQQRLNGEGIQCYPLEAKIAGSVEDSQATADIASQLQAKWIVADGYQFGRNFQQSLTASGFRLAIVTDFDYCARWDCELVVNQNPHASTENYASDRESFQRLLGTRYALLRREFLTSRADDDQRGADDSKRLLVTLGGSDPSNATGRTLKLLDEIDPHLAGEPMEIGVLVGAANPHMESLQRQVAESRHRTRLITNVTDMPSQYHWADGIIGAGGSSCWEWLYFGLRGAILVIADNQRPIYDELTSQGIALGLGTADELPSDFARSQLENFLQELAQAPLQPERFRQIVDGHGAERLAAAIDSGVWLRPATIEDREMYFQWANDALVRTQSLTTDAIPWSSHCDWFAAQLASAEAHLLVGIRDEQPVGQIRFHRNSQGDWNVGFSVAAEARGAGIGKQLVDLGSRWMTADKDATLVATVRSNNQASARCFESLGWDKIASERPDLLQFTLSRKRQAH